MKTAGFCSAALVLFVVFLVLRVAFIFGVIALVCSIAQWQVDHRVAFAVAVGLALLLPNSSSSSSSHTTRSYR